MPRIKPVPTPPVLLNNRAPADAADARAATPPRPRPPAATRPTAVYSDADGA